MGAQLSVNRDDDFYAWLLSQADALRSHQPGFIEWAELAEELEEMAASDRREVVKHFRRLLAHFLKWAYSAVKRSENSWKASIVGARLDLSLMFEQRSLKSLAPELLAAGYRQACKLAGQQMHLTDFEWKRLFPEQCPWTLEQLLDDDFFPAIAPTANGRVKR